MPIYVATKKIPQGSHTFNLGLEFSIPGFVGSEYHESGDTWAVRITNPEGVTTAITSITFLDATEPIAYFNVTANLLDKEGTYYYQVIKTTSGANLKSTVSSFEVEGSVPI